MSIGLVTVALYYLCYSFSNHTDVLKVISNGYSFLLMVWLHTFLGYDFLNCSWHWNLFAFKYLNELRRTITFSGGHFQLQYFWIEKFFLWSKPKMWMQLLTSYWQKSGLDNVTSAADHCQLWLGADSFLINFHFKLIFSFPIWHQHRAGPAMNSLPFANT